MTFSIQRNSYQVSVLAVVQKHPPGVVRPVVDELAVGVPLQGVPLGREILENIVSGDMREKAYFFTFRPACALSR